MPISSRHRWQRAPALDATLLAILVAASAARAQLVTVGNQQIFQSDVGGASEAGDHFGEALAAGDFNRDGYSDLAIGVPDEDVGAIADAGAVFVIYGTASGLGGGPTAAQVIHQDVAAVQNVAQAGDRFGAALAAGDFNGDGWTDLAVGVPGESADGGASTRAGAVQVFLSSVGGVVAAADTFLGADAFGGTYAAQTDGVLGSALAACDLDGDGRDDLVVGAPGDPTATYTGGGVVLRLFGGAGGLSAAGALAWVYDNNTNRFGASVACTDPDSAGHSWVAAGAPLNNFTSSVDAGAVVVYRDQADFGAFYAPQTDGREGTAVALGSFQGPGDTGLIAGIPGWDFTGTIDDAGQAHFWGMGDGLSHGFGQQSAGVPGEGAEPYDGFGDVIAAGDFDRDGHDDAVFGVPGENLNDGLPFAKLNAGIVLTVPGGPGGPTTSGADYLDLDVLSFGTLANDRFGAALAIGDFDGNGVDDLAIGAPSALWDGESGTGLVQVVFGWPPGWIFGDDFEAGNSQKWSAP